jgi:hypothetical protein
MAVRKSAAHPKARSMYARLVYARRETVRILRNFLESEADYDIFQVFVLTVALFGAIQLALNQINNIILSLVFGSVEAVIFFLSMVGFITLSCVVFLFVYNFTVGREPSFDLPRLSGWRRGLGVGLSVAVSGIVTLTSFKLFYEGVREIPVLGPEYARLLYDGGDSKEPEQPAPAAMVDGYGAGRTRATFPFERPLRSPEHAVR